MRFTVITMGMKNPKYYVARERIGGTGYTTIASTHDEVYATQIADALNRSAEQSAKVVPIKRKRA